MQEMSADPDLAVLIDGVIGDGRAVFYYNADECHD